MAGKNEIDVLIKTKADTAGVEKATKATKEYGEGLDHAGEKAGDTETRIIGVHDVIDGTATIMQGPGEQGMVAYIQGWADLAGGVEGVLPLLKAMSIEAIKNGATQVATAAKTVGAWLAMKATAVASAAQMAIAWTISLGPIAIVVAALAGLGVAFALLWAKSQTFRNIVVGVWNDIKGAAGVVYGLFQDFLGLFKKLGDAILTLIRYALGPFIGAWRTVAGVLSGVKNLVSDVLEQAGIVERKHPWLFRSTSATGITGSTGGSSRKAGFAHGGISPGGRIRMAENGPEDIELPAGMRIRTNADSMAGGGGVGEVRVVFDFSAAGDSETAKWLKSVLQPAVRRQSGGSVQRHLGFGAA